MAKQRKTPNPAAADLRAIARLNYVADLRDGRRQRASTFVDRKKQARKNACRGRVAY